VTKRNDIVSSVLSEQLEPSLLALGFSRVKPLRWRRNGLEVRPVIDSKATDPFRGRAFTLEFERSDNEQFEVKLTGRSRVDQLLDASQARQFLVLRNDIASRLPRPTDHHLAAIPESVRPEYLKAFRPAEELEPRFWMRFANPHDLREWCVLLSELMPDLIARANTLDPHGLVLGQSLSWQ
jgi:hypothetical protein